MEGYVCGDCLKLLPEIPSASVDLVLCDLPYGTTGCEWDVVIPFPDLWAQYNRVVKLNGAVLLFGTEPFASRLRLSNVKDYRYDWVWDKGRAANFFFMNKQPGKITETVSVFYRKQPTYNPQKRVNPNGVHKGSTYKNPAKISQNVRDMMGASWHPTQMDGARQNYSGKDYEPDKLLPTNILSFAKDVKRVHPTQKPVALLEYLVRTYTHTGELVLDNCAGSGSTGVACLNAGRRFILMDSDPAAFERGRSRVDEHASRRREQGI